MRNYHEFPRLTSYADGTYQLVGRLHWRTFIVPDGFITDGASVPKFLQWLVPSWGNYQWAAIIHDYLLKCGWDRDYADRQFLLAMEDADLPWLFRKSLYWAVRTFSRPAPIPERE